ncbi:MAG TPA: hypothetical protein VL625_12835 [Patescibacteria group bacterium]|jgi:hypothetical protein|nr:hypothetical protein [Patescibacteria group bacterium]
MANPSNAIPGILPPQAQFDLGEEMSKMGFDATGGTPGKGWKEYTDYAKANPGTCPTFDDIRKKLSSSDPNTPLGQLEISMNAGLSKIDRLRGMLTNTFTRNGFNPDDQEIYTNRSDIRQQFISGIMARDTRGTPLDPLVAERMEQLMIKFPSEVDPQSRRVMQHVLDDPAHFGLKTESAGYFNNNAGVKFSSNNGPN